MVLEVDQVDLMGQVQMAMAAAMANNGANNFANLPGNLPTTIQRRFNLAAIQRRIRGNFGGNDLGISKLYFRAIFLYLRVSIVI